MDLRRERTEICQDIDKRRPYNREVKLDKDSDRKKAKEILQIIRISYCRTLVRINKYVLPTYKITPLIGVWRGVDNSFAKRRN